MQVVMVAVGSRGDVQPLLALALKLRARGHDIVFAAQPNFSAWLTEHRFEHRAVGVDTQAFAHVIAKDIAHPIRFYRQLVGQFENGAREQFNALPTLARQAQVIVGGSLDISGPSVAQFLGIPHVGVHFFPGGFPTRELPPPALLPFEMPRWLNPWLWRWVEASGRKPLVEGIVNKHRKALGIPPFPGTPIQYTRSGGNILVASDPLLGSMPGDVREAFTQTGFWFFDDDQLLPPEVLRFLEEGPPPLYIGLGSMVTADTARHTQLFVQAVEALGCRAIMSSGWAGLGDGALPKSILRVGPVNHAALFPRLRGAVHHGGAGTTAAVARAGIPQLLLPHLMDQYYWGRQIQSKQLGPEMLPIRSLKSGALQKGMSQLLHNPTFKMNAERLGERLKQTNGVENAIAHLERLVGNSQKHSPEVKA